jgi:hypothetical protein
MKGELVRRNLFGRGVLSGRVNVQGEEDDLLTAYALGHCEQMFLSPTPRDQATESF